LSALAPADDPGRVSLVYHGLDLSDMPAPPERRAVSGTFTILSVGRLVEKKGYDLVLRALAALPASMDWRFVHIGGGELKDELAAMANVLGLANRIDWRGAKARDAVLGAMREADLFVLPSRITASQDRDGLPNVLMEAASQKLPVISTSISAIPEFVDDGQSGVLVPAEDVEALTAAIEALVSDPAQRGRYADALYARLVDDFGADAGIDAVAARIRAAMP
jgi:glycosyltransferase involved in cell wall biosynthesis